MTSGSTAHTPSEVRAAFGSHNLRSLAYAVVWARALGIPDHGYEIQMLYGMALPVQAALRRLGLRLRVYAPVGELVPGMAYLVRRLLEKTRLAGLGAAVGRMSHDLRNLLSTAVLVSDRLEASPDPEVRSAASRLIATLDHAIDLCAQTLDYARSRPPAPAPRARSLRPSSAGGR